MNMLSDSFSYAFRGSGKYMLIIGAVLYVVISVASFAPIFGIFAYLFLSAYFCATYFSIIESTAVGDSEAPNFPDVSNVLEDLIWPMIKVLVVGIFSFLPLILYGQFLADGEDLISRILLIGGIVYFPMAILAVVVLGYLGAMSPHIVIPGIFRAGWRYGLGVVMLYVIYTFEGSMSEVLHGRVIMGTIIMGFVGMYVLMTSARILGLVYKDREEKLCWL